MPRRTTSSSSRLGRPLAPDGLRGVTQGVTSLTTSRPPQLVFVYEILYHFSIATAKLSALVFYLRIFTAATGKGLYIATIVSMGVIIASSLVIMVWGIVIVGNILAGSLWRAPL